MTTRDSKLVRRLRQEIGRRDDNDPFSERARAIITRIKARYTTQWEHERGQRMLAHLDRLG